MRIVDQQVMNRLFAATDELGLEREAITVPLAMEGEGRVAAARGKVEITLPDADDLAPFLAGLRQRLRALGVAPASAEE
jgi:hypothetical protein